MWKFLAGVIRARYAALRFLCSSTGRSGCKKYFSIPLMLDNRFFPARIIRLSQGQLSLMRIGLGQVGSDVQDE